MRLILVKEVMATAATFTALVMIEINGFLFLLFNNTIPLRGGRKIIER